MDENGFIADSDEELVAVEEHDDKYIHDVVEEQPEFPGGMNALMTYFCDNIQTHVCHETTIHRVRHL